jgi:hypothetical protein
VTEESLARTTLVIARAALERRCSDGYLEEHLADALVRIAIDSCLPLDIRNEAYRLLEAAAQGSQ